MNLLRLLGQAQANLASTRAIIYNQQEQEKYLRGVVDTLTNLYQGEQQEQIASKAAEEVAMKAAEEAAKIKAASEITEDILEPEEGDECVSPS